MAGIGWRLERLIDRSLAGAAAAYATGGAVMALPWVLTAIVLASLPAVIRPGTMDFVTANTAVNVAHAIALLVAGPIQIVISRYAADRMYEGRVGSIVAPFCRGLALTLVACASFTAITLLALGEPRDTVIWGASLSAAVGAQWTAVSVGNGFCSPLRVLGAVVMGSALGFLLATLLVDLAGLGIPGYLFGLIAGQVLTLVLLLVTILRTLPDEADPDARLLPAFRDYAPLAVAGLAFNASLWIDKLVAWRLVGGEAAVLHSIASTLAWFSTIPGLAWIYVEVETTFYRRFRAFYRDLEGGASLAELRSGIRDLREDAARCLRGGASVQAGVILFLQFAADPLARGLGLDPAVLLPYRLLLVAAGVLSLSLLGLILLYYFDLRQHAVIGASGLLLGVTTFTAAAAGLGLPPSAGTLLGCCLGAILTWHGVFRGIGEVLEHTMLVQPFGAERERRAEGA